MVTISVVMPTYNTAVPFLKEAVESILNQTIQDFEFIIIDDGSTNESVEYLKSLTDPRIRIIRNETNIGITKSLNIGFHEAKGKYIARMDSDDISLPDRFEKQLEFMSKNQDVIVCGSRVVHFTDKPPLIKPLLGRDIEDMESYRVKMLFVNPGPSHPTALFAHDKLIQHHIIYDEELYFSQSYGMWMTASRYGRICILPEVLLLHRIHENEISIAFRERQIHFDQMTQIKQLKHLLAREISQKEAGAHYYYSTGYYKEATITSEIAKWYDTLIEANRKRKIYNQMKLKKYIIRIKKRLIEQTFTKDTPVYKKVIMLLRYLPVLTVTGIVLKRVYLLLKRGN